MTKGKSSGTYVVDAGFNIVNFNQTAKDIYPMLKTGEKCYKALMNGTEPCTTCPIVREVMGPQHYEDPIRHIDETVDCVDMPLPDGSIGHALIFSTVEENGLEPRFEIDTLTGVYTKHAFYHHCSNLLQRDEESDYAMVVSDIENFKLINAAFGEDAGDRLLQYLGQTFREKAEGGICGRIAGDEFAVLMKLDDAWNKDRFQAMMKDVEKGAPIDNVVIRYGIYEHVDRRLPMSQICDRAITAVKSIKHNYQKFYATYDGPVSQKQYRSQMYESRFMQAIRDHEFVLQYQPQYDARTRLLTGAEALVRWREADGRLVPPGEFLPVFEEDGLIERLDAYVFETVLLEQKKLIEQGVSVLPISVNLSRTSMYGPDIAARYAETARRFGILPRLVPVEITETAAVSSVSIKPLAEAFHEEGFSLFMDDFGSGRSSLNSLNILPFSLIKIDKSLVDFIGNPQGNKVIESTIALAKDLGLTVVAEGVENETQLLFLREKGCDIIQGYYFSKPLPVEEFEELLRQNNVPGHREIRREA